MILSNICLPSLRGWLNDLEYGAAAVRWSELPRLFLILRRLDSDWTLRRMAVCPPAELLTGTPSHKHKEI